MKAAPFQYDRAASVEHALDLLAGSDRARVLAGGQSLMPLLALRRIAVDRLVDVNGIDALAGIAPADGEVRIGAVTRQRTVEKSEAVASRLPMLAAATKYIAHFQIRNRGTVGGSAAYGDPAAEIPTALLAHGGSVEVVSAARGRRLIPAKELYVGAFQTSLEPDELLVEVRFPVLPAGAGWCFDEVARVRGNYAIASAAVWVDMSDEQVESLCIVVGGTDARPVRISTAEDVLRGCEVSPDLIDMCGDEVARALDPVADVHSSADYRRHAAGVLVRRGLTSAINRARGRHL